VSAEQFERFRSAVLSDVALQQRLSAYTERDAFVDAVVRAAAEAHLAVTADDVEEAMRAGRRSWLERWV
jgi:hypothetical protein